MITSQLVLTTGYCVRNAITIKVQCTVSSIVEPIEQNLKDSTYTYKLKCIDLQKKIIIWKGIVQLCMVTLRKVDLDFQLIIHIINNHNEKLWN